MEESITNMQHETPDLYQCLKERFAMGEVDLRTYSPLTLAYIGDAIYDLVIRSLVVGNGNTNPNQLHRQTSQMVKAHAQSDMMQYILPELTEDEEHIYRRGRNAKSATTAKNATVGDYRRATGFEALMGYLYMKGENQRLLDLVTLGLQHLEIGKSYLKGIESSNEI